MFFQNSAEFFNRSLTDMTDSALLISWLVLQYSTSLLTCCGGWHVSCELLWSRLLTSLGTVSRELHMLGIGAEFGVVAWKLAVEAEDILRGKLFWFSVALWKRFWVVVLSESELRIPKKKLLVREPIEGAGCFGKLGSVIWWFSLFGCSGSWNSCPNFGGILAIISNVRINIFLDRVPAMLICYS